MIDLKNFRKKHNLTQKQLAQILKVGEATISSWETGRRKPTPAGLAWIEFTLRNFEYEKGE